MRTAICAVISISAAVTMVRPVHANETNDAKIVLAGTNLRADKITGHNGPQGTTKGSEILIIHPPLHPSVIAIVPPANTICESAVVLKGRGFMYGIARGETPVLGHSQCAP
ncbi:hypothetical protein C5748_07640 [Phyllobacterium phragmitis]|uniref:Uncharacterized protein n=1 Tax=Phyllobacterium phragmitis TaxID=2670329 RepID=A0A2S9IVA2_9HYPH|nr:hypothetical protein C5748_07640 [Phyllobacterium phragmitis]